MADYFTNFSMILPLPSEAAQTYAADLAEQVSYGQTGDEHLPDDFPASLREVVDDWVFETVPNDPADGWGLWLHSSSGGLDAVCVFIQHLLARFDPAGHATLEWSNDCSKPRVDAFGGGAAIITARNVQTINTGAWLHRRVARLPQAATSGAISPMKLHLKPNDQIGFWEVHDENGFLCKLESQSIAALIIRAVNVLPELVVALEMAEPAVEYHHRHEGCPITLKTVRRAIQRANTINPPPAVAGG